MTKRKDENELAKSIIDIIIGETESENWCKTLEPKKAKRRSKHPRSETENQTKGAGVKVCC